VYFAAPDPDQARAQHSRIAAGIAVSLALHGMLLSVWRNHPVRLPSEPEPPRILAVQVRPLAPLPEAVPPTPAKPAVRRPRERARKPVQTEAAPTRAGESASRLSIPEASPPAERAPQTEPRAEPSATPHFDAAAARNFARRIANDPDPAKVGTAVAQFPDESYHPHTRIERAIGAAKRRDCKDGLPGGLLAPLFLMLDKKDSGCKW
jgi:hypothetical protein